MLCCSRVCRQLQFLNAVKKIFLARRGKFWFSGRNCQMTHFSIAKYWVRFVEKPWQFNRKLCIMKPKVPTFEGKLTHFKGFCSFSSYRWTSLKSGNILFCDVFENPFKANFLSQFCFLNQKWLWWIAVILFGAYYFKPHDRSSKVTFEVKSQDFFREMVVIRA